MPYQSLQKLFYMDKSSNRKASSEALARTRFESESTFRTGFYTPSGELFLAVPRELSLLNELVLRRERQVSAGMRSLPIVARRAMIRSLVIDEVVSTNALEGIYSTRRQINELLMADANKAARTNRKRFTELAKLYLNLTDPDQKRPATPEDIRRVYDIVMSGEPLDERDSPDGKLFRRGRVDVIGSDGRVIHEGLYPESHIIESVERMLEIVDSPEIPEIYSAIIGHFLFEYTHPFYDGNGRTGRYLLALHLSRPLSILTSLSLSRVIAERREAYYRSFREAEHPLNHGELTLFVMNMLENVGTAQEELIANMHHKEQVLKKAGARLSEFSKLHDLSKKEGGVVDMLLQLQLFARFPEATQDEVAEYIGLSGQQSRLHTKRLEEKGLIELASRRPLRFVLSEQAIAELGLREAEEGND